MGCLEGVIFKGVELLDPADDGLAGEGRGLYDGRCGSRGDEIRGQEREGQGEEGPWNTLYMCSHFCESF